jgi:hypothetical protein
MTDFEAPDAVRETLSITPLPITWGLTLFWFGHWSFAPEASTPQGPFTHGGALIHKGHVEYGHRFWALQGILNMGPDSPTAPDTFNSDQFGKIVGDEKYRVIQRYKTKFLVTEGGRIKSGSSVPFHHVAKTGR